MSLRRPLALLSLALLLLGLEPSCRLAPEAAHIVVVTAEREYSTRETLPAFLEETFAEHSDLTFTWLDAPEADTFAHPSLEALEGADLLILSVRRRALRAEDLTRLEDYLARGGPIVGIRTASHAYDTKGAAAEREGYRDWPSFDPEVFGGNYQGHHGNKGVDDEVTLVWGEEAAAAHPVLRDVALAELPARSWLYRVSPLEDGSEILLMGRVGDRLPHEPVAWTFARPLRAPPVPGGESARSFYTSLGHPEDFEEARFRQLLRNGILWALGRDQGQAPRHREGPARPDPPRSSHRTR